VKQESDFLLNTHSENVLRDEIVNGFFHQNARFYTERKLFHETHKIKKLAIG
jgi:hypothetical protein